ncbi:hypothetical protein [Gimesia fumaroli]|uniref:Uncharacterized protein n=1 Tax=Gimesia fumaroli TaxID=2527976 RepID=A0A518I8Y6_9PLAN|nr:hypothetical protein [Gimesia fumaroli]QDV49557.1 hypothetical protein Enr17x_15770 [Gimesia fumaroli]
MSGDSDKLKERVDQFVFENAPDGLSLHHARGLADDIYSRMHPLNWTTTIPPVPSEPTDFLKHTTPAPTFYQPHEGLDSPGPKEKKM